MLINSNDTDIILVDNSGQIIYDDIGNYRYFQLGMESAVGKNIRDLFRDLPHQFSGRMVHLHVLKKARQLKISKRFLLPAVASDSQKPARVTPFMMGKSLSGL